MKFRFALAEHGGPNITIEESIWFGKVRVYVNDIELKRLKEKDKAFLIQMNDGSFRKMIVKNSIFDYVPKVFMDEKEIRLARKLHGYEQIMAGIPLLLVFVGGVLGAIFGVLGAFFNFRILRTEYSLASKILFILGITSICVIGYLMSVIIFNTLIGR